MSFSTNYDEKEKLWRGPEIVSLCDANTSLSELLMKALSTYGSKTAQIWDDTGVRMSFDEIRIKAIRVAQNLQKRGVKPKQVCGFLAKNSHHVTPIVLASIFIGCPVNGLESGKTRMLDMLKTTNPSVMFCDVEAYDMLHECLTELGNGAEVFTFGGSKCGSEPYEVLLEETHIEAEFVPTKIDGINDIAFIVYSSGTTGPVKGTCISPAVLAQSIPQFVGILQGVTRVTSGESYSPELILRLIEQYKVTHLSSHPRDLRLMEKCANFHTTDLSSLRCVITGGTKMPMDLKRELNRRLSNGKVYVGYGMTETLRISKEYPVSNKLDTVGQLAPGLIVKIIDDHGHRCGPNVGGELCVKIQPKPLGYYNNEQATNKLFDAEGFILTGDVGHFDENGNMYIGDRKTDIWTYCGVQIYPSAIDDFLMRSPDIKSSCVVGIHIHESVDGDLPAALVVRAEGSNITEKQVFDLVAEHFADACKLRGGVYFVDEIPATLSGKIRRATAKEIGTQLFNERQKCDFIV